MRLICPNCDAQYEVPDSVIPVDGRDVQCSDCGQTWFQAHPDQMVEDEPEVEAPPAPPPPVSRRKIDASVQDILREEAALEAAARAREAGALESQPELGLGEEDNARRSRESRERMARMRGEETADKQAAAVAAAAGSRRDLLPDIEEINSTLRSASDRKSTSVEMNDIDPETLNGKRGGFWGGFSFIMLLVALAALAYVFAPQIARTFPQSDPWLSTFVAQVDNLRVWLNGQLVGMSEWLAETAASQDGS